MTAELGSVAYVSSAVTPLVVAALELLHQQAIANNRRDGITGVLLYNAGNFMQYVEGPQPELARLYTRIQADARHTHVIELLNGPVAHRSFEQWHMGLAQATASDVLALSTARWQRLHDDPKSDPAQSQGLALLLSFWRQERA